MVFLKRTLVTTLSLIGGLYLLNTAFISLSSPIDQGMVVDVPGDKIPEHIPNSLIVQGVDELNAGPLPGNTMGGLVDVFHPGEIMYINNVFFNDPTMEQYWPQLFTHEYAHVSQKELVSHYTGGYPSYWNPVQTVKYLVTLTKLNNDLEAYAPVSKPVDEGRVVFGSNLETSADCAVDAYAYNSNYLGYKNSADCTVEQIAASLAVGAKKWPTVENIKIFIGEAETIVEQRPDSKTRNSNISLNKTRDN